MPIPSHLSSKRQSVSSVHSTPVQSTPVHSSAAPPPPSLQAAAHAHVRQAARPGHTAASMQVQYLAAVAGGQGGERMHDNDHVHRIQHRNFGPITRGPESARQFCAFTALILGCGHGCVWLFPCWTWVGGCRYCTDVDMCVCVYVCVCTFAVVRIVCTYRITHHGMKKHPHDSHPYPLFPPVSSVAPIALDHPSPYACVVLDPQIYTPSHMRNRIRST